MQTNCIHGSPFYLYSDGWALQTYYAHAVDLAFAVTVWKCQGGNFDYIIALLEHTPGSPTITFEKLYVMFTRVKRAC